MKKTFTKIEELLYELRNVQKAQNIMLDQGMVDRTEAGALFFMSTMNKTNRIYQNLSEYPYHWVQAVERIIEKRSS